MSAPANDRIDVRNGPVRLVIDGSAEGKTVGTISIAGPSARIDDERVRVLAGLVTRCAEQLSNVWPVRRKAGAAFTETKGRPRERARRTVSA